MTDDTTASSPRPSRRRSPTSRSTRTLKQYEAAGVISYILPTEPLGEEWILGVPDGLGGPMKLKGKDQAGGLARGCGHGRALGP